MSVQITTAFVDQFKNNVDLLVQQRGSRLRNYVRRETVVGKNAFFEQIGAVDARKRTVRHADTPQLDVPHARRMLSPEDYDWADLIDQEDRLRMLIDPTGPYSMSASMAMGRAMDSEILRALNGTANTGVNGSGTADLTAANKVAVAAAGLNTTKLIAAKKILDGFDVDENIVRHIAMRSAHLAQMLADTSAINSDFNVIKALVQGEINTWLGFEFHRTELVNLVDGSATDAAVMAWAQDAVVLGVGKEATGKIDLRPDKNYATQVFYSMTIGAVRMEEKKVVEISCLNT